MCNDRGQNVKNEGPRLETVSRVRKLKNEGPKMNNNKGQKVYKMNHQKQELKIKEQNGNVK